MRVTQSAATPEARAVNGSPDRALLRAQKVLAMWREGRSAHEIADALDLPVSPVEATLRVLVSPDERMARRMEAVPRAQQKSDDELIRMLQACAVEIGRTPGTGAFDRWANHFWSQLLFMRFGSWAEACSRAGLVPNERPEHLGKRSYSDEDHLRAYLRIKELVGDRPVTVGAWVKHGIPGEPKDGTLRRRYGTWRAFRAAMEQAARDPANGAPGTPTSQSRHEQRLDWTADSQTEVEEECA